jgi:hypothetical protein
VGLDVSSDTADDGDAALQLVVRATPCLICASGGSSMTLIVTQCVESLLPPRLVDSTCTTQHYECEKICGPGQARGWLYMLSQHLSVRTYSVDDVHS